MFSPARTAMIFALSLLTAAVVLAQTTGEPPPFAPGRPGITESGGVVGEGVLQLEAGLALESAHTARNWTRSLSVPSALLRMGLSRRGELRLSSEGALTEWAGSPLGRERQTGYGDLSIGGKLVLLDETRAGFELSVLPSLSLPIGGRDFSSRGYDPSLSLAIAHNLPAGFGVSGTANAGWLTDDGTRSLVRSASAALGHGLFADWSGFAEAYAERSGEGGGDVWVLNTGVAHMIGAQAQIDVQLGHGVTASSPGWTCGFGIVLRRTGLSLR